MKRLLLSLLAGASLSVGVSHLVRASDPADDLRVAQADVHVNGYTRKDGTYVAPHMQSAPDGNPRNNYSYPGNVNPYTGKQATGNPDTYLRNNGAGRGSVTSDPRSNNPYGR